MFRHRYILSLLVRREIAARYQGSVLGLLWSYVNPLSQFFIYYFVMGILFGRAQRTEDFAIHVFAGLIVVHFFTETMNAGTRSIVRNKSLVQKMAVPREMFPVASMLVSLFHVVPAAGDPAGRHPDRGLAARPRGADARRDRPADQHDAGHRAGADVQRRQRLPPRRLNAVNVLSNFVRFGVPMMYPYILVAKRFHGHTTLYLLNPIIEAVLDFQRAFWVGATSHPARTAAIDMPRQPVLASIRALLISLVVLAVAQSTFTRLERRIPERLL